MEPPKRFVEWDEVGVLLRRIIKSIDATGEAPVVIFAPQKGGLPAGTMLAYWYTQGEWSCQLVPVVCQGYDPKTNRPYRNGHRRLVKRLIEEPHGPGRAIFFDDIADEGLAARTSLDWLRDAYPRLDIETAFLFVKNGRSIVRPDHVGEELDQIGVDEHGEPVFPWMEYPWERPSLTRWLDLP